MKLKYVANQLTPEGLDEVQRLLLAYHLGQHTAISGPPGVGKTQLVEQLPRIVKRPLFDITCDAYMTEAPLVGFPVLEGESNTITVWKNGEATKAAVENGIFYGDEFDLLPGSVQKRLDSLFDDRRRIKRRDGENIEAGDDFFGVVSYNPSEKISRRELEDAVADRFIHFSFEYLPAKLEATLALEDTSRLNLGERAIIYTKDSLQFIKRDNKRSQWKDYFTDEKVTHPKGAVVYEVMPDKNQDLILPAKISKDELSDKISDYFVSVRSFADHGTNRLKNEIVKYLREIGQQTSVQLHKPSTRIIKKSMEQYDLLTSMGMDQRFAQSYAARICVDQICYGRFGLQQLDNITVKDAISKLGEFYGLFGKPKQTTKFTKQK